MATIRRVGTGSSDWNCQRDGHFVPPQDLAKKLVSLCKARGADLMPNESVAFLSKCLQCKVEIGCRLTMGTNGKILKFTKALRTPEDLRRWFTEQNEQKFSQLVPEKPVSNSRLACFCTKPTISEIEGTPLCKEHLLQILLTDKFEGIIDFKSMIKRIQAGPESNIVTLAGKKESEAWVLLLKFLTLDELPQFFLHAPEILAKLKVEKRAQRIEVGKIGID